MRHGLGLVAAIVGLVLAAGAGLAQDAVQDGQIDCAAAETQTDLNACARMDFDEAESNLNDAFKAAVAAMRNLKAAGGNSGADMGAKAVLREAQRAWVTFRDLACASQRWRVHGGSMEPMVVVQCKPRISGTRADDLWAQSEESGG